ncbi:MAG: hypothetical protein ACP5EL_08470 [Methanocrinis sp.]
MVTTVGRAHPSGIPGFAASQPISSPSIYKRSRLAGRKYWGRGEVEVETSRSGSIQSAPLCTSPAPKSYKGPRGMGGVA